MCYENSFSSRYVSRYWADEKVKMNQTPSIREMPSPANRAETIPTIDLNRVVVDQPVVLNQPRARNQRAAQPAVGSTCVHISRL